MRLIVRSALLGFVLALGFGSSALGATYNFEGPRKASATVSSAGNAYEVAVEFRAVASFDEGRNLKINRMKAEDYARRALILELQVGDGQGLTLSGLSRAQSALNGKQFSARFRVARSSVKVVSTGRNKKKDGLERKGGEVTRPRSKLLTAKADFVDTAQLLAQALAGELPPFSEFGFAEAQQDWEIRVESNFQRLLASVNADMLESNLLPNEATEITEQDIPRIRASLAAKTREHKRLNDRIETLRSSCRKALPDLRADAGDFDEVRAGGKKTCLGALGRTFSEEDANTRLLTIQKDHLGVAIAETEGEYTTTLRTLVRLRKQLDDAERICLRSLPQPVASDSFYEGIAQVESDCMRRLKEVTSELSQSTSLSRTQLETARLAIQDRKSHVLSTLKKHIAEVEDK